MTTFQYWLLLVLLLPSFACTFLEEPPPTPSSSFLHGSFEIDTFDTEQGPRSFAFDGEHLWVTLYGVQNVSKFDLQGRNKGTFKAGKYPRALAYDNKNIWVGNSGENTGSKHSLDGILLDTIQVGNHDTAPAALAFDGQHIWVAASWGNSVSKIQLDGSVEKTVQVPGFHQWCFGNDSRRFGEHYPCWNH